MVLQAPLLVAALLSTAPYAPFSRTPVCDETGVYTLDDEGAAADSVAASSDGESVATASCTQPPPPLVLACNDDPAGRWTQDMIGSCDMPRTVSPPLLQRPSRDHRSVCRGSGCETDPMPLRAAGRSDDGTSSLALSKLALTPFFEESSLARRLSLRPPSAASSRLERPPRV